MKEKFALVRASVNDKNRKKRIEVSSEDFEAIVVAIKVDYISIHDNITHVHWGNESDKTVLKIIYKDRHNKLYYTGREQYGNKALLEKIDDKIYLTEKEEKDMYSFIIRYKENMKKAEEDRDY